MDTVELFRGIGVLIDDDIDDDSAKVQNILKQIKNKNIPILTYKAIPEPDLYSNFRNLSFLILDWEILDDELKKLKEENVRLTKTLIREYENRNIAFIKEITKICYCPIFVISNLKGKVETRLKKEKMYSDDLKKPNHIFVKSKNELEGTKKLFTEIDKWVKKNPSIYVLKKWEKQYHKSKNRLFLDFQELSPVWPRVMWKTFEKDNVNKSLELGELISRNIHTRMAPFEFEDGYLNKKRNKIEQSEIRKVLEGERFLGAGNLDKDDIATGDLFKLKGTYCLNIRANCDLIPNRNDPDSELNYVQLYLIKGSKLSLKKEKREFNTQYGNFSEIDSQSIIFPIEGRAICFNFKDLDICYWLELKENRIGRILSPYINRIQQKYAAYFQRQGLPRTPAKAVLKSY